MAVDVVVPNLGESISEATVATWMKKAGEVVAADETLLELETDKATLEVPAPTGGVVSEILVEEGEDVEVGAVLARIDEDGGSASEREAAADRDRGAEVSESATQESEKSPEPVEPAPGEAADRSPSGSAATPIGLDASGVGRSGPGGTVTLSDLREFFDRAAREAVEISGPAVRKLIADHGLDPGRIPASGRGGRISKADVLRFLEQADAEERTGEPTQRERPRARDEEPDRREERVKLSRLRRTIASRLKEAQNTAAILTTFNEVDMSEVVALRARYREAFEEKHGVRLGFMSFFVKAVTGALREMPQVNASIDEDHIVYKHYHDIGIAVSTDAGLKVPIIRDASQKSFASIEREIADLAARARDGSLTLEEMEGGTFSITNGGVFGSLLSTPILNPPQSAILGLHKIQERAVVIAGSVEVRPMMYLALSYDHRLVDGRESVTFLVRVKELIEDPDRLMLEV